VFPELNRTYEKQTPAHHGLHRGPRLLCAALPCGYQKIAFAVTESQRVRITKGYGRSEDQGDSVAGAKYRHRLR
jgi:hypothetical protein